MKIAITGASGFVGRHVSSKLLNQGEEVIAITRDASRIENISSFKGIFEMDISCPSKKCFERMGSPDILIHLAWDGLPNYKSLHHYEQELSYQYNFLKLMIQDGLSSLVVTGTCFEYGMQSGKLSESTSTKPTNPYGYAKDALRQQLEYLKSNNSFKLTWARLFYMYGKDQSRESLYPLLKNSIKRGDKIFNMSGGDQLRDYLHIDDVANKIVQIAMLQKDIGPVNICSGKPISVLSLVENWLRENDSNIELKLGYYPYPDYEPMEFWGDDSKFNSFFKD
jgi:dTDP-6-deoxy-L-talose 4-dehydrogenase (NAD+)